MIFIAHRGNIDGPQEAEENTPEYIDKAIRSGFNVEIDVWFKGDCFALGHDTPDNKISIDFLLNRKDILWCHAKNTITLHELYRIGMHCFFHENDDCTLTSKGHIWTYPGSVLTSSSIFVMPESIPEWYLHVINWLKTDLPYAVCSDHIGLIREKWNK